MSNPLFSERAFPAAASPFSRTATAPAIPLSSAKAIRRCAGRTIRREGKAAWALVTGHGARYRQPHHRAVSGNQSIEQKKGETMRFPTLNFEAFSISAILRILKLINASKTHFSINNSKSYYKMRKTLFFWFVQFHTVLEVYEPQTLV